jgi:hypothetical protein
MESEGLLALDSSSTANSLITLSMPQTNMRWSVLATNPANR